MHKSLIALAALLLPFPAFAASTPAEKNMAATVAAEASRQEALLERLVNINSGSLNLPGVTKVGEMMRAELASTSRGST